MNSFSRSCQSLERSCRKSGPSNWQPDQKRHSAVSEMQVLACTPCLSCGSPRQAVTSSPVCCLERRADFTEGVSKVQRKGNESLCVLIRLSLLPLQPASCFCSALPWLSRCPWPSRASWPLSCWMPQASHVRPGRWYSIIKHKVCDGTSLAVLW